MPIWLIPSLVGGAAGWIASDVTDSVSENNKLFWVAVGAAGFWYAHKKGVFK